MATMRLIPSSGAPIEITRDVLVGRDPTCDIVLTDGSVSRRHARIQKRDTEWMVVDQGSANGTFIDSQRVMDSSLRQGQELRFGALGYRIEIIGEPGSEATIVQPTPAVVPPRPSAPPPPPMHASPARPVRPAPPGKLVPRPAGKSKGPFFWIVAGGCGCVTCVLLLIAAFAAFLFVPTMGAVSVVQKQTDEIRGGDLAAAYSHLSADYQSRLSREEFQLFVQSHPALVENAKLSISYRSWKNKTALLRGELTAASGDKAQVEYSLVKESNQWRISSISLN